MKIDRHPDPPIDRAIDEAAHTMIRTMSPLQIGLMRYPNATPRQVQQVPPEVVSDHLNRYTMQDLLQGQFLEVLPGKYMFIMGHDTKKRKDLESEQ